MLNLCISKNAFACARGTYGYRPTWYRTSTSRAIRVADRRSESDTTRARDDSRSESDGEPSRRIHVPGKFLLCRLSLLLTHTTARCALCETKGDAGARARWRRSSEGEPSDSLGRLLLPFFVVRCPRARVTKRLLCPAHRVEPCRASRELRRRRRSFASNTVR